MLQQSGFIPQRQFHVLVNDANEEHNLTVMPGTEGNFKALMKQLENHISNYYNCAF